MIYIYYDKIEGAVSMWHCPARPDQILRRDLTFERNTEGPLKRDQETSVLDLYYVYCSLAKNVLHIHSFVHPFIQSVIPSFLHSFILTSVSWQVLLVSLRSSSSCLPLLPRLPITAIFHLLFVLTTCFRRQFLRKM